MRKSLVLVLILATSLARPVMPQERHTTFFLGAGPTFPVNLTNMYFDNGYNISLGGGWKANRMLELLGEFDYFGLGVKSPVLRRLAVPQGSGRIYSLTANAKYNLVPGPIHVYAIGGGGWYHRTVEFTEPTTSVITVFDPWWGYFGNALVPANRILGSITRDSGGINAGGGIEFSVRHGAKVYAESRWHRAFHNPTNTTLIPLTFGIRF